ncbi:hypothetical protein M3G50_07270 [Brachybacterium muris]|uniref:hypothetical protein n=1 Tax=Brachybacterium muris TaxID=219301 RepID=UPI0021A3821E|nr:hypothetical protein [Brachybacterium muris]MCT1430552.1 hypothetical protein [Brachybacterium muris]
MLVTMTARLVRSHGKDEIPLPGSGRIEYRPESHGTYQGALRGMDAVVSKIAEGVAEPVELTPGPWRVTVVPDHGPAWRSWLIELEPGMPEPVDLVDLAPVVVVDGEKWARGPAGASVTGGRDNGDGTVSFELSDGTFTDPVVLPPGPAGRGIASISDPDADSRVTITFTDDTTTTVQAIRGADGHTPVITWEGTSIVVDGEQGPDLKGEPGADSTVPGPAPTVSWDGDRLVVEGAAGPSLTGPEGPAPTVAWSGDRLIVGGVQGPSLTGPASTVPGPPGQVLTPESMLVVGPGRPDAPTTTGLSAAQLTALPVGCEYRSTDGASVGAWVWQKRPTGWVVTQGDTRWVTLTPNEGVSLDYLRMRRDGNRVTFGFKLADASAGGKFIYTLPVGFRVGESGWYATTPMIPIYRGGTKTLIAGWRVTLHMVWVGDGTPVGECMTEWSWITDDAWPATLPGTPAS